MIWHYLTEILKSIHVIIGRRIAVTGEMNLVWMDLIIVYGFIPPLTPSDRDEPWKFKDSISSLWSRNQTWKDRMLHRHSIGTGKVKILMQGNISCLRHSVVDVVAWIRAGWYWFRTLAGSRDFSFLQYVHTRSEAHPDSQWYRGPFPRAKPQGRKVNHSTLSTTSITSWREHRKLHVFEETVYGEKNSYGIRCVCKIVLLTNRWSFATQN